jgi:hypothetical protein
MQIVIHFPKINQNDKKNIDIYKVEKAQSSKNIDIGNGIIPHI